MLEMGILCCFFLNYYISNSTYTPILGQEGGVGGGGRGVWVEPCGWLGMVRLLKTLEVVIFHQWPVDTCSCL